VRHHVGLVVTRLLRHLRSGEIVGLWLAGWQASWSTSERKKFKPAK
jgi:hypothetical protein